MIFDLTYEYIKTKSPYGAKALANIQPLLKDELENEWADIEKCISYITHHSHIIKDIEVQLAHIKDIEGSISKLAYKRDITDIDCFEIKVFLLHVERLSNAYAMLPSHISDISITPIDEVLELLDPEGHRLPTFHIYVRYSDKLSDIRQAKLEIEHKIRKTSGQTKEKLLQDRSLLVQEEHKEEMAVLHKLTEKMFPHVESFKDIFSSIKRLDLLLAKAHFAIAYGGTKPLLIEEGLHVIDALHPPLIQILEKNKKSFTPVSIDLRLGTTILTGANMGGKSVALQTIFIQVELFRYGFYPLASYFSMMYVDEAFLLQDDTSSIKTGLSSFAANMNDFNNAIKNIHEKSLFIALDEFARGTNPEEGAKIVRAVSKFLHTQHSIALLATHYEDIATETMGHFQVAGLKNIDFSRISHVDDLYQYMDYHLLPVASNKEVPKDALNIIKLMHVNKEIIDELEKYYD